MQHAGKNKINLNSKMCELTPHLPVHTATAFTLDRRTPPGHFRRHFLCGVASGGALRPLRSLFAHWFLISLSNQNVVSVNKQIKKKNLEKKIPTRN